MTILKDDVVFKEKINSYYSKRSFTPHWRQGFQIVIVEIMNFVFRHILALSTFITHDVTFQSFHYEIRVYTMWLAQLILSLLHQGYKAWDIAHIFCRIMKLNIFITRV